MELTFKLGETDDKQGKEIKYIVCFVNTKENPSVQ